MPTPLPSLSTSIDHLARARHLLAQALTEFERGVTSLSPTDEARAVAMGRVVTKLRDAAEMARKLAPGG